MEKKYNHILTTVAETLIGIELRKDFKIVHNL